MTTLGSRVGKAANKPTMRDKISLERCELLHPKIRQEVIDTITEIESNHFPPTVKIRVVQGLRTIQEQNDLYALGRTKPGKIVTNAKGGKSFHNYGPAFDFALMYDKDGNGSFEILSWNTGEDFDNDNIKDWTEVVNAFKEKGWEWGGDWKKFPDYPHLQKTFGYTVSQLLAKHNATDFIPGTQYVNL